MPVEPKLAASVAAVAGRSLLWGRRSESAKFLPGFHVMPGGVLHETDGRAPHDGGPQARLRVAALRELFEETGVLVASPEPGEAEKASLRDAFRTDPVEGAERFAALGLVWQTSRLEALGRWVTPTFAPQRFDASFFLLRLEEPVPVDPALDELDELEWVEAGAALARWSRGRILLAPPLASVLRAMAAGDVRRARDAHGADGRPTQRWEVVPDLAALSVRTPTLPPATHTNTFLVGRRAAVLIEPATPYADELERTVLWVEEARELGVEPVAILATHHHRDHVGGARALTERLGLPLWAHAETARRVDVPVARLLEDGDVIDLDGQPIRVLHTPGHAPGHLCFLDERSGVLIAGDMVAGVGTILIEPTDGDMALYLASLERLLEPEPSILFPAHGGPLTHPEAIVRHYVKHRLEREGHVLSALRAIGSGSPLDLLPSAYADVPRAVWPLAALSTEAHLLTLEREGLVRRRDGAWQAV